MQPFLLRIQVINNIQVKFILETHHKKLMCSLILGRLLFTYLQIDALMDVMIKLNISCQKIKILMIWIVLNMGMDRDILTGLNRDWK